VVTVVLGLAAVVATALAGIAASRASHYTGNAKRAANHGQEAARLQADVERFIQIDGQFTASTFTARASVLAASARQLGVQAREVAPAAERLRLVATALISMLDSSSSSRPHPTNTSTPRRPAESGSQSGSPTVRPSTSVSNSPTPSASSSITAIQRSGPPSLSKSLDSSPHRGADVTLAMYLPADSGTFKEAGGLSASLIERVESQLHKIGTVAADVQTAAFSASDDASARADRNVDGVLRDEAIVLAALLLLAIWGVNLLAMTRRGSQSMALQGPGLGSIEVGHDVDTAPSLVMDPGPSAVAPSRQHRDRPMPLPPDQPTRQSAPPTPTRRQRSRQPVAATSGRPAIALDAFADDVHAVLAASIRGTQHESKGVGREDSFAILRTALPHSVLLAVADGVGNSSDSHIASAAAMETIVGTFNAFTEQQLAAITASEKSWEQAADQLVSAICTAIKQDSFGAVAGAPEPSRRARPGAATTVSLALLTAVGDSARLFWLAVGDSPILLLEGNDPQPSVVWNPPKSRSGVDALPKHPTSRHTGVEEIRQLRALLVMSDGMEEVLMGVPGLPTKVVSELLAHPGQSTAALPLLMQHVDGACDDRTLVAAARPASAAGPASPPDPSVDPS
jgi:hypothetical protein